MPSKLSFPSRLLLAGVSVFAAACTHTPPGTSVEVALARKPEVVRLPQVASANPSVPVHQPSSGGGLPNNGIGSAAEARNVQIADAFSRGEFCLRAGNVPEAISAFQEVVKLDPHFPGAWQQLAACYEQTGDEQNALLAYKKSKEYTE